MPRDRDGDFEPVVVKNHQRSVSGIEDQVIGMYAKGITTRDIAAQLEKIYGIDASPTLISKITDKILPLAQEWQGYLQGRIRSNRSQHRGQKKMCLAFG